MTITKNKLLIAGLVLITLPMLAYITYEPISRLSKPIITASLTVDRPYIKPIGSIKNFELMSDDQKLSIVNKITEKSTIKIRYINTSNKTLKNPKIRLHVIRSEPDKTPNFFILGKINIGGYKQEDADNLIITIPDIPPNSTKISGVYLVAQRPGLVELSAELIVDKEKAKTSSITITAK